MAQLKPTHRCIVALALPKAVAALITYVEQVVQSITGNPSSSTPSSTLAAISAAITDLTASEATALSKAKGTAQACNDERAFWATTTATGPEAVTPSAVAD